MNKKIFTVFISIALILSALPMPVSAQKLDKVTLQLRWQHQYQFAGYYMAKWNGYYEEEGLDVDIRSAFTKEGVVQSTEEVLLNRADFGVGSSDILIAEDRGMSLKLIASFFQKSPVEYYALESTAINSALDLPQLDVARRQNDLLDIEYQVILQQEGMNTEANTYMVLERDFTLEDLTSGRFDIVPGYLGKIPYFAAQKNISLKRINAHQYGIDFYGDTLFTSSRLADENPLLVERFRRASIKGWLYALEHPEEVAKLISKEYPVLNMGADAELEFNLQQAKEVQALMLYPDVEIGNMNPFRWKKMASTLKLLGITESQANIDNLIFNYERLKQVHFERTVRMVGIIVLIMLLFSGLALVVYLKWRNKTLQQEVAYRKTLQHHLKLSTLRYETIFNSSVIGITLTTPQGNIVSHNCAWSNMLGYLPEEMQSMNIKELIHPEDKHLDVTQLQELANQDITNYVTTKRYLKKNGETFWGKLFMTQIMDLSSEMPLNMGMVIDITREVAESEAVKRSEALMLNQSRMAAMGEMIGNIAHQWRQPLNTLNLVMANIKDAHDHNELTSTEMAESQAKAHQLIQKMSETIDDFRYFSTPRTTPESFNVKEAIGIAVSLLEVQIKHNHIQFTEQIPDALEHFGYDNQLTQAILNLLSNAIDATMNESLVERQILLQVLETDTACLIEISDNGPGIVEKAQANIFDMYFTTKATSGGTGLGLYMTKTIIESIFKGEIELMPVGPLKGATFKITLPKEGMTQMGGSLRD